jgi:hypothetical protein
LLHGPWQIAEYDSFDRRLCLCGHWLYDRLYGVLPYGMIHT